MKGEVKILINFKLYLKPIICNALKLSFKSLKAQNKTIQVHIVVDVMF